MNADIKSLQTILFKRLSVFLKLKSEVLFCSFHLLNGYVEVFSCMLCAYSKYNHLWMNNYYTCRPDSILEKGQTRSYFLNAGFIWNGAKMPYKVKLIVGQQIWSLKAMTFKSLIYR